MKLASAGTGDIFLKANRVYDTIGKFHLSRVDRDDIRLNTIEYGNNVDLPYIKLLVHYGGGDNTLQREVLKLNSDLSSNFDGTVTGTDMNMTGNYKINGLNLSGSNLEYSTGVIINSKIDLKANLASPTFSGTVTRVSKSMVGLGNVLIIAVSSSGGTNLTYNTTTDKIDLAIDLPSVNSISSVNNTDLKLKSTGTGDALLKANPNLSGTCKIHLSRIDHDAVRNCV